LSASGGSTLFLGVDGGGTSTEAWLADETGRVVGRGKSGPSNAKAVGPVVARKSLEDAIAGAFADAWLAPRPAAVACLGLAGFDRPEDRRVLRAWSDDSRWAQQLVLVNDGDLVVAAGTPDGWGVGLIAGTGSIAVGRTPDGRTARAGGWGPLVGDEGSAYRVVLDALRLVFRRADRRDPAPPGREPLTELIFRALGVETAQQLVPVIYAPGFDRTRIASLAPVVLAAAEEDPTLVGDLLHPAADALAEMARAVARDLGWTEGELPLALAGGFLLSATVIAERVSNRLAQDGFLPRVSPVPEPVRGAVVLAERAFREAGR
jgi:N-acetylglucosamine kinase-like BadF-type ATPase